jgi:hypothetical protein
MLSGFSVQDRATLTRDRNMASLDGDLCMLELLDEHPEARELLRGYTFARTFH